MCAEFGVTPRTLRYYEYIELIAPERDGRKRLYTARDRGRLKLILLGRRFGFALERIRQWLDLYDQDTGPELQVRMWIESSAVRLEELEREREELDQTIEELRALHEAASSGLLTGKRLAAE
ncbi:MerR family DNA-binding protein [Paroceanicella profunda]|nr:MerR family DNA-binding protein [Paroceanicella profunda]